MYDPLQLSEKIERIVSRNYSRKYYRFRSAKFYGGISSADCCGCNLRCYFCWSNDLAREGKIGKFYSPEEVSGKLIAIAKKFGFHQIRITGNEPTIGKEHLLAVIENIPGDYLFILETNGILLGNDEDYVRELSRFKNLHVRVSLKGCTPREFSRLTGVVPEAFELQLKALEHCVDNNISCHPALMFDLIDRKNIKVLSNRLREIDPKLANNLEMEGLIEYPHVVTRLKKVGLI